MRPRIIQIPRTGLSSIKGPAFVVASLEFGNVSTRCTLTATDLRARRTFILAQASRPTREAGAREGGLVTTISGIQLTSGSLQKLIARVLQDSLSSAGISFEDIHFAVPITSVFGGLPDLPSVGSVKQAILKGCIRAGLPQGCVRRPVKLEELEPELRSFSSLGKGEFKGFVAGIRTPIEPRFTANEVESVLAAAGIVEGGGLSLSSSVMALDLGATLSGLVVDESARPSALLCGLAGAVVDALAMGSGGVDPISGSVSELPDEEGEAYPRVAEDWAEKVMKLVSIGRAAMGKRSLGMVPIDAKGAYENRVTLIGCEISGGNLSKLIELGREIASYGISTLRALIDRICARIIARLIEVADNEGLLAKRTVFGVAGRAGVTGEKPRLLLEFLKGLGFENVQNRAIFIQNGLALGAAVLARCLYGLCPACRLCETCGVQY